MRWILNRYVWTVLLLGAVACEDERAKDDSSRDARTDASSEPSSVGTSEPGGEADADDVDDAGTDEPGEEPGDDDPAQPMEDEDGGVADGEADGAASGPEPDASPDSAPVIDTGSGCHKRDANGPVVVTNMVTTRWASASGGNIQLGTYHLIEEEHFLPPGVTLEEAPHCAEFVPNSRETLGLTEHEWSRVAQGPGWEGREIFAYEVAGVEVKRTRRCPTEADAPLFTYTAAGDELRVFEVSATCEYMFRYQRVQAE